MAKDLKQLARTALALQAEVEIFHIQPTFPENKAFKKFSSETTLKQLAANSGLKEVSYKLITTRADNDFYRGAEQHRIEEDPDMLCVITRKKG